MLNVVYKKYWYFHITRVKVSGPCSAHSIAYFCVPRMDGPLDINEKNILIPIIFFRLYPLAVRLPYTDRSSTN